MGEWRVPVSSRMRADLRAEMIEFAQRAKRSLGNLGSVLLERSFEELKAAGNTNALFGRRAKRLNRITPDRRFRGG